MSQYNKICQPNSMRTIPFLFQSQTSTRPHYFRPPVEAEHGGGREREVGHFSYYIYV